MDFFTALVRYEVGLWDMVDDALQRQGQISLARLQAIDVVGRHDGGARVLDISAEIGITVGAASKLVDRLERDGLAMRAPNPDDRRSSLIALTESGQRTRRAAAEVRDGVIRAAIDPDDEQAALQVVANLQQQLDDYREQVVA